MKNATAEVERGKNVLDNFFLVVLWWYAHKAKKKMLQKTKNAGEGCRHREITIKNGQRRSVKTREHTRNHVWHVVVFDGGTRGREKGGMNNNRENPCTPPAAA
jgi:hypothetical protein